MMVNNMKWAVGLLCCLNLASAAELAAGRTVYLMPMGRGLDQYIANRLTRTHLLQVVTDPVKADAIITDQVGTMFEDLMKDLIPPPPEAKDSAKDKDKDTKDKDTKDAKDKDAKDKEKEKEREKPDVAQSRGLVSMLGDTANKPEKIGSMGLYGRSRGTVFLVDVQSRRVLWSSYEKPKNTSPHELDRAAERIVKLMKADFEGKTKTPQ